MQTIKEHIKKNQFTPFYLLYGTEDYLKKLYRKKLKDAILGEDSGMNYSYLEGKDVNSGKVGEFLRTYPFFGTYRLMVIENSGIFKGQNDFTEVLKELPDTSYIVFVEKEVDKRNRLYKLIKEKGTISEMNGLDESNLILWTASLFGKAGKKISESTILYLLEKVGTDMEGLSREMEKVICYALDREVITCEDIDAVCTTQVTGKIFQMIDAIGSKKQKVALQMYDDLLAVKEKPMSIFFLMTRHFNSLLQMKELNGQNEKSSVLSQKVGIPPFAVSKYLFQAKNFTKDGLLQVLKSCVEMEEMIKTGVFLDQIGVELLIVKFSSLS